MADQEGKWQIALDPLKGSSQPTTLGIRSTNDYTLVELNDVVVGEVWICSGQSNMQMAATVTPELKTLFEASSGIRFSPFVEPWPLRSRTNAKDNGPLPHPIAP